MSATVRRRLEALEQQPGLQGESLTLLVQFVSPGQLDCEIFALRRLDGPLVEREVGESEAAFIKRAAALARSADGRPVVLFAEA